jgi:membrane protein
LKSITPLVSIVKEIIDKYQKDRAYVMVAATAFYVLLTFIPFTLLTMSILGFVMDRSDIDEHLLVYTFKVVPAPYNKTVTEFMAENMQRIESLRHLSGPLGLYFLFFFTSKLFSVLIPSFHLIFNTKMDSFLKMKGKEMLFTLLFSLLQGIVFFMTVILFVMTSRMVSVISGQQHRFLEGTFWLYLFSLLDMLCVFGLFYLLYYVLTPLRKETGLLLGTTFLATFLWWLGKSLFKLYALHVGRFTLFFGSYGIFLAFLFWLYYSVFVFIVCAELQSVLLPRLNRAPRPSSAPVPSTP